MKTAIDFYYPVLIFLFLVSACESTSTSADYPDINTSVSITPENDLFEVGQKSENSDDSKLNIKFINESDDTLYYARPSFYATLQKLTGVQWDDQGVWYAVNDIGPTQQRIAPGDTVNTVGLNLQGIATQMPQLIDESGLYRVHFKIYRDKELNELIPEKDRVSKPFEVKL